MELLLYLYSPSGTKISKPTELKAAERGGKNPVSGLLGINCERSHSYFHPFISRFWLWRRQHHIMVSDSEHMLHARRQNPILSWWCLPTWKSSHLPESIQLLQRPRSILNAGVIGISIPACLESLIVALISTVPTGMQFASRLLIW